MNKDQKISANKQRKIEAVTILEEKLQKAKALFLADYRGLTHKQLEDLRRKLKKVEAEFVVAKNRLFKIALKNWKSELSEKFEESLKNPSAVFFSYGDAMNAIKTLANFIKNTQLPTIKLGIFEQKVVSASEFNNIAALPSRDQLIALLALRMKSPLYGLHYALNWNLQKFVLALKAVKNNKSA